MPQAGQGPGELAPPRRRALATKKLGSTKRAKVSRILCLPEFLERRNKFKRGPPGRAEGRIIGANSNANAILNAPLLETCGSMSAASRLPARLLGGNRVICRNSSFPAPGPSPLPPPRRPVYHFVRLSRVDRPARPCALRCSRATTFAKTTGTAAPYRRCQNFNVTPCGALCRYVFRPLRKSKTAGWPNREPASADARC